MIIEQFSHKFTSIPFATTSRDHKSNTSKNNIDTLFHIHKEVELLLVLSGKAKLFVDNKSFDIEQGDLILIPPYTMHRYTIFSSFSFKHYCMCFDLDLLYDKELKDRLENGAATLKTIIKNNEKYAKFVIDAFGADMNKKDGWELYVIGNISLLFSDLIKENFIFNKSNNNHKPTCHKIVDYINKNYHKGITSADVADELYLNHSYFCRIFRENFGYTFQNYLCMYRIEKAKSYLKNTNISVSEIAALVGFNSFSYFSKKFREYTYFSPSEYRKQKKA